MPTRPSTIKEHRRDGKKLIPPLLQLPMTPRSWMNDALPEMLWAILLISQLDREEALDIFKKVALKLADYVLKNPTPTIHVTHTGLAALAPEVMYDILSDITANEKAKTASIPLLFYQDLPGYDVWKKIISKEPDEKDWDKLLPAINKTLFHQSQESTDCRWLKVFFMHEAKRYFVTKRLSHLIKEVVDYPNEGDMRQVRASIRATEIGLDIPNSKTEAKWAPIFWKKSLELTKCFPYTQPAEPVKVENGETKNRMHGRFVDLLNMFGNSLSSTKTDPKREGIFGIAFYAWRLTLEITVAKLSELASGRLALRALVESYIVLAYLLKIDDEKLWSTYRKYGTGQAKLAQLKFEEEGYPAFVDKRMLDTIANEDAWTEFVPIDLGNWGGLDLRKMSELSGTKKDYDIFYNWTSGFSHANWGAVRETVFQICGNPLHRLHRIPLLYDKLLPDFSPEALALFEKVFSLVCSIYPNPAPKNKNPEKRGQNNSYDS